MPPLVNWEGSFNFFKWDPSSGSFTVDDVIVLSKKVKVNFYGIPYHLKSKEIVQSLANHCGSRWDILEETINPSSDRCSVMMHNIDFSKIPRVIFLVEKEIRSPVMVEVEGCFPKGGWEPTRPEQSVVGCLPKPILVGHGEGSQTRHGSKGNMSVELSKPPGYEHALGQTNGREFQNSNFVNEIQNEGQFYVSNNPFEVLAMQDLQSAQNSLESGEESIKAHTSSLLVGELRPMDEPKDDGSDGEPLSPVYRFRKVRRSKDPVKKRNAVNMLWPKHMCLPYGTKGRSKSRGPRILQRSHSNQAQVSIGGPSTFAQYNEIDSEMSVDPILVSTHCDLVQERACPSREEEAQSLMKCGENRDALTLIKWVVIPLAQRLGMTTTMGNEGLIKLFNELCKGKEAEVTPNAYCEYEEDIHGNDIVNHVD
ncbi:hypothetical protein FRX31_027913 [Thalictrum thalictroides]|uniref:Uncharacterized protein n=1 Tax=Thalictrum thalictroides TaxID=46969 RepID=A0A7J6VCY0_THATH|nr:hypothetical protein FRX31_027913 [Thalictrum thalictroides]